MRAASFLRMKPANNPSDPPEMKYWRPVGFDDDQSDVEKASNIPYLKEQIRLYRIVENMMTTVFSPRTQAADSTRQSTLDNLNLELIKWRNSLPLFARWNKWTTSGITPAVATLQ